jgi:hypothetical protein
MNVHNADDSFQFDKLALTPPNGIVGGSYLTKYAYNGSKSPLYIQTPKTKSKQGIVVVGKKAYIDILVTNSDTDFIEWIANLEKQSIDLLFEKRHLWFTEELDKTDIENSFTPVIRPFKSGQSFLVRVNLELNRVSTHNQPFMCKVFDENRRIVNVEYVKPEHQIMSILEFQGIKFTKRNFQIELFIRQVLVIPDVPLFDTCVITSSTAAPNTALSSATPTMASVEPVQATNVLENSPINNSTIDNSTIDNSTRKVINTTEHLGEDVSFRDATLYLHESNDQAEITNNTANIGDNSSGSLKHFEFTEVDIDFNNISDTIDVEPASFDIDRSADATTHATTHAVTATQKKQNIWKNGGQVTLKKHKEVLYEMYKVAKRKAQEAKKTAIRAYLEAKEIKATYMLDDLEDSESGSESGSDSGGSESKYKK